ncbi:MAG: UvrY/SirA/GacA family response regulator transcription factor [Gammaproteobacteria bacterium]|nr:UvrY/SirA/GacA family response regulator transcription factor [Gammaproteobacteria bacterium]
MVTVLLVDDHALVRTGIRYILDGTEGIEVVAEACDGDEAILKARELNPDVILMDVNMPGIGGLECTRKLLQINPDTRIIALTVYVDEPYPSQLLDMGARGYLTKGCAVEEVVNAVIKVHSGERYLSEDVARQLALSRISGNDRTPFNDLSQRELQVMIMLTRGVKVQDISDQLCISPKTVTTYRYRLYDKLKVKNDVEMTHLAMRYGMLTDEVSSHH